MVWISKSGGLRWVLFNLILWTWPVANVFSRSAPQSWSAPSLTHLDSLFIIAATGEPRFKLIRDSCEKILIADTTVPDYLITSRLNGQTPRQRHYVEHLFIAISDSGRNSLAMRKIALALPKSTDSLKAQLLHIGSELGDSAFLNVARLYLAADSEEVRKAAVRSLGMYRNTKDVSGLLDRIEKTRGLERQQNLWALSRHKTIKEWIRLLPMLRDDMLYNRQVTRRLLDSASAGKWTVLAKCRPGTMGPIERLEWALLAMGHRDPEAQAYVKEEIPLLAPLALKFMQAESRSLPPKF